MASEYLEHKLRLLPDKPGCYLMKNAAGTIIYVGKAKNLKNRVRSYFKSHHEGKVAKMVSEVADFETIITATNKESFLLEITLIQKHQPHFNILLKEGTGYPYIKITNDRDPELKMVSTIENDGAYYFGPYPNATAAQETLQLLWKVYPLRRCHGHQGRPCLYYHLGQCLGACFKPVPRAEYERQIKAIKSFLNGNTAAITRELQQQMEVAAANLEFERAAELRDQLHYIKVTVEKQKIISNDQTPRDIFSWYVDKGWLSIQIFFIRQARLMKRIKRLFPIVDEPVEEITNFIIQFYQQANQLPPKEILVQAGLPNSEISEILGVPVRTPQRGEKKELVAMATENAQLSLDERFRLLAMDTKKTTGAMQEITDALGLPSGHTIEAFDHSHIQGTDPVSAMVVFVDGEPVKKLYRKYKLTTVINHADETASTKEVIRRRYTRLLKEGAPMPDIIMMDGGVIQMQAARDVLENELDLDIPVVGMVKNDHHKTADLLFGPQDDHINLDPRSQGFYLVQRIQDEVHRFAVTFHRSVRTKHSLSSRLDAIKGVGPRTRTKLMKEYGSINKIAQASVEDLRALGINEPTAQLIKVSLQKQAEVAKPSSHD
ncbi:excinuclease ABC subunit UvrC [Limosilactobacillus equigenerosi]|uniref:UvrABC system protein C n=1 Tax=Limosilactobacillus equigenerosi DSM 18793 = JCM 14505 TaxID=1423742 RepID=A0A0R1UNQ8_9LACO|nr:excinuclease ABC subunit UvrC [Limosilactobacillus equigenerosi]KRL94782.1 UvrABC system protein C (Protein uvrC) [Limosilactobacillus equigenerosi DSM 18793 = JCM 14505]